MVIDILFMSCNKQGGTAQWMKNLSNNFSFLSISTDDQMQNFKKIVIFRRISQGAYPKVPIEHRDPPIFI